MDPFSTRFRSLAGRMRDVAGDAWPAEKRRLTEFADEMDCLARDLESAGLLEPAIDPLPKVAEGHGTEAGYKAHRRRAEDACRPCKAAHVAYNRKAG